MPTTPTGEKSLLDYWDVLRRRKIWIIALVLVTMGISIGVDLLSQKSYGASAAMELVSQNVSATTGAVDLSPTDIATDIELVQSTAVNQLVAKALGVSAPPVTVSEIGTTQVLTVTVSSTSKTFAVRAANAYVNAYITYTADRFAKQNQQEAATLHAQQATLQSEIATTESEIAKSGSGSANSALTTQLEGYAAQLVQTNESLSQIQLDEVQAPAGATVVTPASTSHLSVSPKLKTDAAIAGFLGLLLGIGLALLLDFLDDRVRNKEDLHEVTGALPLLGEIPIFTNYEARNAADTVVLQRPNSPIAEAFRSLRTAVQFLGFDSDVTNVYQITSPSQGEGKSTTVINLAMTMAKSGARVVIVSCDLRRPSMHQYFKASNAVGLSSVLSGYSTVSDATVYHEEFLSLSCVPSGPVPPNPSELLSSPRFAKVLEELRETNDFVLVDSPALLPVTDSLVVAQHVDFVILLARAEVSHRKALALSMELLENVNAPVKGVILNAELPETGGYRYGGYRGYRGYGRYGGYRDSTYGNYTAPTA